ncbi:MAG: NifB/NifX family molybdenum-iron cluster-binding protein [Gudongella sp.]|nr:NifB/NifX family molybdenum-iron cluster-binding protein [Gudongella sp.]
MKIAIASDKKQVAAHFGHCEAFECFEVEDNKIKGWETLLNPGHKPGFLPNFLHENGVSTIIAGGMGQAAANIFNDNDIKVICGASGSIESVAKNYVDNTLQSSGSLCEEHDH